MLSIQNYDLIDERIIYKHLLLLAQSNTQNHSCDEHPKGGIGACETHKKNEERGILSTFTISTNFGFTFSNNKRPYNSNDNRLLDNVQHPNKVISCICLLCSTIHHTPLSLSVPPPLPLPPHNQDPHTSHNPSRRDNPLTLSHTICGIIMASYNIPIPPTITLPCQSYHPHQS